MKYSYILLCLALVIANSACGQDKPIESPITLEELFRRKVVGQLGLSLGTAVEIEAEVVSGSSLRRKAYDGLYLLKVTHVDGKELSTPPVMKFSLGELAAAELANDTFALYEMTHGKEATRLDSSQIAEIEKGYVGKTTRLVVYEVGSFRGIPNQLPEDVPVWADSGFHFSTSLTVLKERDKASKSGRTKR